MKENRVKNTLCIFDQKTVSNASVVRTADTPGMTMGVAISGENAFAADYNRGIAVIDISSPTSAFRVGNETDAGWIAGASTSGNYIYTASSSGVKIYDITDPENPSEVRFIHTIAKSEKIALSGDYTHVAAAGESAIINISSPERVIVDYTAPLAEAGDQAYDVDVSGEYTDVTCKIYETSRYLQIVDITDLESAFVLRLTGRTHLIIEATI